MFLCIENPAVEFQAPQCCPNGLHLIKWSLQLCQSSMCCRPFHFGNLQRNRMRYRIKCSGFCRESLGGLYIGQKSFTMQNAGLSVLVLSTGGQSAVTSCSPLWLQCWAGKNLPQVPSKEGKTLPVLQQSSELQARGIIGIFKVFHKGEVSAFSSLTSFP